MPEERAGLSEKLKRQTFELYRPIQGYNPHVWKLLVRDLDSGMLRRPGAYRLRTKEEALLDTAMLRGRRRRVDEHRKLGRLNK